MADSLPQEVLLKFLAEKAARLRALEARKIHELESKPKDTAEEIERDYHRNIERYLDKGVGACHLRRPDIAKIVAEALCHSHNTQYLLDDWVIMPNHVHLILWPMPNFTLSEILKGRKQFTANQSNRILSLTGTPFWQPESFDHWIRDDEEKSRIRRYIRNNPVKAGLCTTPEEWRWGSASRV